MKRAFKILILFLSINNLGRTQNLVSNPGFEYYASCPEYLSQLYEAVGWFDCGIDPDYFHYNSWGQVNVPNSVWGYQYAHSGLGMAGLGAFIREFPLGQANGREYIGTKLIDTLKVGKKYFISFYTNFAGNIQGYQKIATNKIGIRFSTKQSGGGPYRPALNNFAHLYTNTILSDTVNWVKISGSFIADSTYSHLTIGNFFDDFNTDTLLIGGPIYGRSASYYYVDDICVSEDSLYCNSFAGINELKDEDKYPFVYPNPSSDEIFIETGRNANCELILFNVFGQEVIKQPLTSKTKIDVNYLNNGTYFYIIRQNKLIIKRNKLIIAH